MSTGLGSLLFAVVLVAVIASFLRVRARNSENSPFREALNDQGILLQLPVMTRAVHLWKFNSLPLKGVIRVEMTLSSGFLQLAYPKSARQAILYKELIFTVSTSRFSMGRLRFPFKRRVCIIVRGEEFGITMEQAVYSRDRMAEILDALQRVGVAITGV